MGKVIVIGILIVAALVAVTVVLYLMRTQSPPDLSNARWEVEELDAEAHPVTSIFLVRGDRKEYWGSVNRMDDDYEDELYRVKAAAEDEAVERNIIRRKLR